MPQRWRKQAAAAAAFLRPFPALPAVQQVNADALPRCAPPGGRLRHSHMLLVAAQELPLAPRSLAGLHHIARSAHASSLPWILGPLLPSRAAPAGAGSCTPPHLRFARPNAGMLCLSNYLWASHFLAHFHQVTHVLCFFLFNVWCDSPAAPHLPIGRAPVCPGAASHRPCAPCARLVPFGFFISLSVKENSLPNQQAAMANEVYREGGHFSQKSGILSAFSFVREKRDDMMPSLAKKV